MRENEWKGCLVRKGEGERKMVGPAVFSLCLPKLNLPKTGRKWKGQKCVLDEIALPPPIWQIFVYLFFSFFCFYFILLLFLDKFFPFLLIYTVRWFWYWVYILGAHLTFLSLLLLLFLSVSSALFFSLFLDPFVICLFNKIIKKSEVLVQIFLIKKCVIFCFI